MRGAAASLAILLLALPARAERVAVRLGDHPGHGRVVLDLAAPDTPYGVEEGPAGTLLRLAPDLTLDIPAPRRLPRNIQALSATADGLLVTTRPGARLRHYRLGNRLVLDVADPARAAPAPAPAPAPVPVASAPVTETLPTAPRPAAARPPSARQRQARTPDPAPPPVAPIPAVTAAPLAAPAPPAPLAAVAPPPQRPAPIPDTPPGATPLRSVPTAEGRALALPLPAETGLAILRRGDVLLIVLDHPHALDAAPLRDDPVFGGLRVEARPEATILRLPLAPPAALQARRDGDRWLLAPVAAPERGRSILAEPEEGRLILRAAAPGRPVPVPDPETGLPILVGTVREGGQAIAAPRSLAQVDLLPTQLGVAALARADTAALRRSGERFVLSGVAAAAAPPDHAAEAAAMTRLMDLPALNPAEAQERLRGQATSIAAAPPLARLPLRRAAAEGLLALGLAQEAQSMMRLAFQEDSRASTDPRALLVHGAAALLAGRPAEAAGLNAPTLPMSDELALWRAALAAPEAEAAPAFAAALPLLLAYPEPLRARLLPLAADTLLEAGSLPAARRLLRVAGDRPDLAFARARLAEAEGRGEEALALYAAVAEGRDRLARARALRRATELRLAAGTLDAAGAAAAMEAALFAWRGDAEEFNTRLRIAALRQGAGDPRGALDLLRETAEAHPDRADRLRPAQESALLQALANEPPTVAVALAETQAALLPADARGAEALSLLADRLGAMDLPDRGALLAQQALDRAPPARRPALATRLATLRLAADDAAGALAALDAAPATPEETIPRGLLAARAKARLGAPAEAAAILRALGTPGLPALATLLAEAGEWSGAAEALATLAAANPEDPATPRDVVRAAAFAALARDMPRLEALRATWLTRLGDGPLAGALAMLTADPVRGLADLPRLGRELDLFRGFPQRLEAFRTAAAVSR